MHPLGTMAYTLGFGKVVRGGALVPRVGFYPNWVPYSTRRASALESSRPGCRSSKRRPGYPGRRGPRALVASYPPPGDALGRCNPVARSPLRA